MKILTRILYSPSNAVFANSFATDGFGASFHYEVPISSDPLPSLTLSDITPEDLVRCRSVAVDPGASNPYVGVTDSSFDSGAFGPVPGELPTYDRSRSQSVPAHAHYHGPGVRSKSVPKPAPSTHYRHRNHEVVSCSAGEYMHLAGFNKTNRKTHKWKEVESIDAAGSPVSSITALESSLPSPKTASNVNISRYIQERLAALPRLMAFYGQDFTALRFHNYRGKQKAYATMLNRLVYGQDRQQSIAQQQSTEKRSQQQHATGVSEPDPVPRIITLQAMDAYAENELAVAIADQLQELEALQEKHAHDSLLLNEGHYQELCGHDKEEADLKRAQVEQLEGLIDRHQARITNMHAQQIADQGELHARQNSEHDQYAASHLEQLHARHQSEQAEMQIVHLTSLRAATDSYQQDLRVLHEYHRQALVYHEQQRARLREAQANQRTDMQQAHRHQMRGMFAQHEDVLAYLHHRHDDIHGQQSPEQLPLQGQQDEPQQAPAPPTPER
jgi:hypothetical protein